MGSVIYEMMGIPGCGKSSICESVDTCIREDYKSEKDFYYMLHNRIGRILSVRYCLFESSKVRNELLRACRLCSFPDKRKMVKKKILKLLRFKGIYFKSEKKYLLSEGYLQSILEIMDVLDVQSLSDCKALYQYVLDDLIKMRELRYIIISVPIEVALERIPNRSTHNSIDAMSEEQRREFIERRFYNTNGLMELVKGIVPKERILCIDGTKPILENARMLSDWMQN